MSPAPRHLALVGMSGVGKSAVGSRLARRLRRQWVDLDRCIERRAGRSVADIIGEDGVAAFRAAETAALADALAAGPASVISTGGGVVLAAENRRLLRQGATVIWLSGEDAAIAARVRSSRTVRPLLDGDLETNVATMNRERRALYEELADIVVDTTGVDPDSVVAAVVECLRDRTGSDHRGSGTAG